MSCGDAWCAGGYRARRRAAERTTTGRRVRMFGVRDIMSRRIARARRAGGRELRRCGLRVDDKKRKIGIASCFMRYLGRGGELRGRPRVPRCSGPYPMQPSAAASFCGTTAARKLAFGRTIRGRFGRRTRFDRAGNPEVMDCSRVPRLLPLASAERGADPVRRDDARLQDRRPHVRLCR